ncbi:MAG: lytic transglycosylase domain-containing protein, partial [Myxococcota bacterium]
KGFWPLLAKHAKKHGFPVELLIAIVREESAFDPLRESYANAIGLTQMIFPTARRFGKGTGIEINRSNLRDPVKNVTVGSRFLAFLWDKWDAQAMLVPPSYNAGENAVARWLKARGTLPADEWIETIKADQPRRYSKRVLSSYFTYSYLYRDRIPEIAFAIPDKLVPGAAKKRTKKSATKSKSKSKSK